MKGYEYIPKIFVSIDLETTGLDTKSDEIIEIGAIKFDSSGNEHITYNALIKPKNKLQDKITRITGITQNMLEEDGLSLDEEILLLLEFIEDYPIVMYNAKFDNSFLKREYKRLNKNPNNRVICGLDMARKAWSRPSYKLSSFASDFGLDAADCHRAIKDCELTGLVYVAAARALGRAYL